MLLICRYHITNKQLCGRLGQTTTGDGHHETTTYTSGRVLMLLDKWLIKFSCGSLIIFGQEVVRTSVNCYNDRLDVICLAATTRDWMLFVWLLQRQTGCHLSGCYNDRLDVICLAATTTDWISFVWLLQTTDWMSFVWLLQRETGCHLSGCYNDRLDVICLAATTTDWMSFVWPLQRQTGCHLSGCYNDRLDVGINIP